MKDLSNALENHIQQEVTSFCSGWKIERQDGQTFFFTDHDQDLVINGDQYISSEGYDRTALKGSSGTDTDELEINGFLRHDALAEEELRAGLFDYAQIHFFLVNWQNPEEGNVPLRKGWIGEVSWTDGFFQAELRGLSDALKRQIGAVYTPECQADLGDRRCKLDLIAMTTSDIVQSVIDSRTLLLTDFNGLDADFAGGILTFTSGRNAGRKIEIEKWQLSTKTVTLFLEAPFEPQEGDTVDLSPGCDKRFITCRGRFSNQLNFRGFPHIPGTDALTETGLG
ncbi:MAG: DUF2163 domain-containing protein [Sneathiella sp.]